MLPAHVVSTEIFISFAFLFTIFLVVGCISSLLQLDKIRVIVANIKGNECDTFCSILPTFADKIVGFTRGDCDKIVVSAMIL